MKSTARKPKRKDKENEKLQHNCFVCLYQRKRNDHLTNLRECRISAVREEKTKGKRNKNAYKEQINKTQDNGEKEKTTR